MNLLEFKVEGSLGNEGPDGFTVFFGTERSGPAQILLGTDVFFTPDQFREFWSEAGRQLRAFDEMAGAPSSVGVTGTQGHEPQTIDVERVVEARGQVADVLTHLWQGTESERGIIADLQHALANIGGSWKPPIDKEKPHAD